MSMTCDLTLHRTAEPGTLQIGASGLRIYRGPASGHRYELDVIDQPGRDWLKRTGMTGQQFARRCDLLAVVAAHAAAHPLPAPEHADPEPVKLRRHSDGSYRTAEQDYAVCRRAPASDQTWQLHRLTGPRRGALTLTAPTLRDARRIISADRYWMDALNS